MEALRVKAAEKPNNGGISPVSVIIPSLDPSETLQKVVDGLAEAGFRDFIIVDDGSSPENRINFPQTGEYDGSCVTVLRHEVNRGKGAALKTAFGWYLENRNGSGVVCADDDMQHLPSDVRRVADMLDYSVGAGLSQVILGSRDFSDRNIKIPKRSRAGNRITSLVFRLLCGVKISDTQTGLRAIPAEYLPDMLKISGDRFEYETNMLLELKKLGIPYLETPITTVYRESGRTSHFRPLADSFRVYSLILKFLCSSLVCTVADWSVYIMLAAILSGFDETPRIFAATAAARIISSALNYLLNRHTVFGDGGKGAVLRYYLLASVQLFVSALTVRGLSWAFSESHTFWLTVFKAIADTLLFFVSFAIQREWVFNRPRKSNDTKR